MNSIMIWNFVLWKISPLSSSQEYNLTLHTLLYHVVNNDLVMTSSLNVGNDDLILDNSYCLFPSNCDIVWPPQLIVASIVNLYIFTSSYNYIVTFLLNGQIIGLTDGLIKW